MLDRSGAPTRRGEGDKDGVSLPRDFDKCREEFEALSHLAAIDRRARNTGIVRDYPAEPMSIAVRPE